MKLTDRYILSLDQGTTSSRAILFNHQGQVLSKAQKDISQIYPQPGWVEHDPIEIWTSQASVATEAITKANIAIDQVAAIGIANQRETTVMWDRQTGLPLYNAIVWQDRRTSAYCDDLKAKGYFNTINSKTGLVIDAYFSASKIKWIFDNIEGVREKADRGGVCFGTVDAWLIWKMTNGAKHCTDITNASRTMLYNIHDQTWDDELLRLFDIPQSILPEVKSNSEIFGTTSGKIFSASIPIAAAAGDQHAALFGQLCLEKGMAKTTYGTGCFLVMNTGKTPIKSKNELLTTIAWKIKEETIFALEGSVFIGGAAVQWLRDGLKIIDHAGETERLAMDLPDNGGVYFVPALTGLGAPYWDQEARGAFFGISRGTTAAHFSRAALESITYQVYDVLKAMEKDSGQKTKGLKVDGGATENNFLMQFQTDILNCIVTRPRFLETPALGAAFMAGLAIGYWKDTSELEVLVEEGTVFTPNMDSDKVIKYLKYWHQAVQRSRSWL
ncbi:glycerol kinase GlpK [Anditalea andensis]|uniref:Glycerol kinase n=1 Tax=Anditalea andensis TaxID=1048983 RepID=A0A074LLH2_9BACT|nr:glycerol kinase GlpK [Anditalea andensis]KEO74692.1 glycerol kinase [Anditalea andensis]